MSHNIPLGTVVVGHTTVNGVTGVTVAGVVVAFGDSSEQYVVGLGFQVVNGSQLVHAREEVLGSLDDPTD